MEVLSDISLMLKVRSGDIDKLALLYERYKNPLFAYFFRITEEKEQSQDLVQSVFYRMLKYRKHYRGEGKFTTWMFGIAHNLVADYFNKKHASYISKESTEAKNMEFHPDANMILEKNEQTRVIRLSIRKLDFEKREVLILSKYHDLKYKEIANMLNISENTVKQRVFRAIQDLRQIYFEMIN